MSQILSLQCLFCQHLNTAGAVFCDDCGGQLDLQPCDQCGAVDSRAATNCYKCGAEFTLLVAPDLALPFTSAIVDKELPYPTPIDPGSADFEAAHLNDGLTYSHPERQLIGKVVSPETSATATVSRGGTPVAILALLLLLITVAVSVYLYRGQPARTQGPNQAVNDMSGLQKPGESAPSTEAAGMDPALKPVDMIQTPAAGTSKIGITPSLTPPGAEAALSSRPLPTTDAEIKTFQDLSVVEKCPPAVATLGLCNPDTQQVKP